MCCMKQEPKLPGEFVNRKEAMTFLGITRDRWETLVKRGLVVRVGKDFGWRKGLYRVSDVERVKSLLKPE